MATEGSDRCEYSLKLGLEHDEFMTDPCQRPTWEDHDLCVWHANVDEKTTEDLEEFRPEPGDSLDGAYLAGASLVGVDWFEDVSLAGADLTAAEINAADFSDASLMLATLTDVSAIGTDFSGANLEGAIFTNADLRRATLEDARINDAVFTDVHIGSETTFGETTVYEREEVTPTLGDDHPLLAASWAYRELQQIYRENALPGLARESYNREKDARRRLAWEQNDFAIAAKWEISRLVMGYGSSVYRVLGVSSLVIVVCAVLFPLTGGIQEVQGGDAITYSVENPENAPAWWIFEVLVRSLYFSAITFATLGYGDIQPIGTWARMLAAVETIIGSLLSALLVFVLTRIVTW